MTSRSREQIGLLTGDLDDLSRQVEVGDIDADAAEKLRAVFKAELALLQSQSAGSATPMQSQRTPAGSSGARKVSPRALVGMAVLASSIAAVAVLLATTVASNAPAVPSQSATVSTGGSSILDATNEELEVVVAQNPEIVGMRLALAGRYFQEGDLDSALGHYMVVLEQEPNPEALAAVGWMTHLSGRSDIALPYLEQALLGDPDSLVATWYLANVQFELGNLDAAAQAVNTVLAGNDVPTEIQGQAKDLLASINSG